MEKSGPPLELLTRRMAECPSVFLQPLRTAKRADGLPAAAVISDLLQDLGSGALTAKDAAAYVPADDKGAGTVRLAVVASWLLHSPWFLEHRPEAKDIFTFFKEQLPELARYCSAEQAVADADRREEFARLCLQALDMRPEGESIAQAEDRLKTISSIERDRVIKASLAAEKRAREVREAMARKAAEEAAASYNRE